MHALVLPQDIRCRVELEHLDRTDPDSLLQSAAPRFQTLSFKSAAWPAGASSIAIVTAMIHFMTKNYEEAWPRGCGAS